MPLKTYEEIVIDLCAQLQIFSAQLQVKETELDGLKKQLTGREADFLSINRALDRANEIAQNLDEEALARANAIMAEAEQSVAGQRERLRRINQEIAQLNAELDELNRIVSAAENNESTVIQEQPKVVLPTPANQPEKKQETAAYTIKLVYFLNARHFVSTGEKPGPIHAHSWEIQIDVKITTIQHNIGFAEHLAAIKTVLEPYENSLLNERYPFHSIQPTTENMGNFFFKILSEHFLTYGLEIAKLTIWESPMRGAEITSPFDSLPLYNQDQQTISQIATSKKPTEDKEERPKKSRNYKDAKGNALWELHHKYFWAKYVFAALLILLTALLFYRGLLGWQLVKIYPWGSDTWGHLFKAEYLYKEILQGNYYPQFTPFWYNGSRPFQYWAPLPYYVIAALRAVTGNIFIAGNYFIFACALLGGMSWLSLSKKMGLWPATMSGIIWVIWPDNVRVALSEGNLPRVLATAMLPLLFYFFFLALEKKQWAAFGVVILLHMVVISHAMIAAIYSVSLLVFAVMLWIFSGVSLRNVIVGCSTLVAGILSSSWWLLPSLKGGITASNSDAATKAVQFVPADISFNPLFRFQNPEVFYWGISLLVVLAASLFLWRGKPPWVKSLYFCCIVLVLITFPSFSTFHRLLPFSYLLWPLRFSSFAGMAMLASSFTLNRNRLRWRSLKSGMGAGIVLLALFAVLFLDAVASQKLLIFTRTEPFDILESSATFQNQAGWRIATLDLSELGSAPSYQFASEAGREQVFGWAWQGAVTSRNIMLLNTALENKLYPYLFRSLVQLGSTDLIIKSRLIKDPAAFQRVAAAAGFSRLKVIGEASLWHGMNSPYLVVKQNNGLAIGKYASHLVLLFPSMESGFSSRIDDYTLEELQKYPLLVLTGAAWGSKAKAERLIIDYAKSGGKVVVDLTGFPKDVLSKQPKFLDVYGESVTLRDRIEFHTPQKTILFQPFDRSNGYWRSYLPQGLDEVVYSLDYFDSQAALLGKKNVEGAGVWFLGGNPIYHAYLTGDPAAIAMLKELFGTTTSFQPQRLIPLTEYQPGENGYQMRYVSEQGGEVIIPVAALEGYQVKIDGAPVIATTFENQLLVSIPAGSHQIDIQLQKTRIFTLGRLITLGIAICGVLLITYLIISQRKKRNEFVQATG